MSIGCSVFEEVVIAIRILYDVFMHRLALPVLCVIVFKRTFLLSYGFVSTLHISYLLAVLARSVSDVAGNMCSVIVHEAL